MAAADFADAGVVFSDDAPLCDLETAATALGRLDMALSLASPALAQGWVARMALAEAAASARLNGVLVDADDLRLLAFDALDRAPDTDLAQALPLHDLIRRAVLRHPRHLYTPRRLAALVLRQRRAPSWFHGATLNDPHATDWREENPWAEESVPTDETPDALAVLRDALDPAFLDRLGRMPALIGAALFLSHWRRSGAEAVLGAAPGRMLAAWWPARRGLVQTRRSGGAGVLGLKGTDTYFQRPYAGGPVLMPSLGFLGHAQDYRPDRGIAWVPAFITASARATERGDALRRRLVSGEARLAAALKPKRSTSRGPQVADHLLAEPVVTAGRLAAALDMSDTAARQILDGLARDRVIQEISGRDSFRAYALE